MPIRTEILMGTFVTIQVISLESESPESEVAIDAAFEWFRRIEACCSRFDESSELMRLCADAGQAVPLSPVLYEAIAFAVAVAEQTGGAFDPTVGHRMVQRGFNREHRTGAIARTTEDDGVSWRDIELDPERSAVTLHKKMTLDLGAVAKGLAIDMGARALAPFRNFAIDAGGDLRFGGCNLKGELWAVGISDPFSEAQIIETLHVSDCAVCTSGGYERPVAGEAAEHHILDPKTGHSPQTVASATVVAPNAMLADALSTAVFVMGPDAGIEFLEHAGVEGLIFTSQRERRQTRGLRRAA